MAAKKTAVKKPAAKKPIKRTRKPVTKKKPVTPIHQWTHDGDRVLLVKCVAKGGKSHNGFQWPKSGVVVTPNWSPEPNCESGGLFGWPWGLNLGSGKCPEYGGDWIVFSAKPESVVRIDGKAKAGPSAEVVFYGSWHEALKYTLAGRVAWVQHAARGASSATGLSGASSATGLSGASSATGVRGASSATGVRGASSATGWRGASSATGERGASSATGERGASSATGVSGASSATGWRGASSATGERGASSATGWRGASSATGVSGAAALTGQYGTIEVGPQAAGVVTADSFTWIVRSGAVILHRWSTGHALLTTGGLSEGQRVSVKCGIITP